ncbi:MAG TPA: flagellar basal body rod protein FlgC [Alphaproteobacteria bacterium]|nr:flagellar basal body rod protein FlgC [Alphaproteobacteria bacterium]
MVMASLDFEDVFKIASSGMRAQGGRLRTIAENIANANSTGDSPGAEPYRRRVTIFQNYVDKASGLTLVKAAPAKPDMSPFGKDFRPGDPAADAQGYVLTPNVKPLIESMDMREAQRTYDANLGVIDTIRNMIARALDVLRG